MYKEVAKSYNFFTLRGSWSLRIRGTGGLAGNDEADSFSSIFGLAELALNVQERIAERDAHAVRVRSIRQDLYTEEWKQTIGTSTTGNHWLVRKKKTHRALMREVQDIEFALIEAVCLLARARFEAWEAALTEAAEVCLDSTRFSCLRQRRLAQYSLLRADIGAAREELMVCVIDADVIKQNIFALKGRSKQLKDTIRFLHQRATHAEYAALRAEQQTLTHENNRLFAEQQVLIAQSERLKREIRGNNIEHFFESVQVLFVPEVLTAIIATALTRHPDLGPTDRNRR